MFLVCLSVPFACVDVVQKTKQTVTQTLSLWEGALPPLEMLTQALVSDMKKVFPSFGEQMDMGLLLHKKPKRKSTTRH
jgi:hypothetical protein